MWPDALFAPCFVLCPSVETLSCALHEPVLHASAAPLTLRERLLLEARPDALLGPLHSPGSISSYLFCGWCPGVAAAGVTCLLSCCGWGPGLEAAGVTCTLSWL